MQYNGSLSWHPFARYASTAALHAKARSAHLVPPAGKISKARCHRHVHTLYFVYHDRIRYTTKNPLERPSMEPLIIITHEPLDRDALVAAVSHPSGGGIVVFGGGVGGSGRGKQVRDL